MMLVLDGLSQAYIKNLKTEFDENSLIHHIHQSSPYSFHIPKSNSFISSFISILFIL